MFLILKGRTGVCICLESIFNCQHASMQDTNYLHSKDKETEALKDEATSIELTTENITTKCLCRGESGLSAPCAHCWTRTAAPTGCSRAPHLHPSAWTLQTTIRYFFYKCSLKAIFPLHQYQIIPITKLTFWKHFPQHSL